MTKQNEMPEVLYVWGCPRSIGDLGFTTTEPQEGHVEYIRKDKYDELKYRFEVAMKTVRDIDDLIEYRNFTKEQLQTLLSDLCMDLHRGEK